MNSSEFHRKCLIFSHGVWKSQKKSHSALWAKRATFTFWVDKSLPKMPKWSILASFWKPEAGGQTMLPDRSLLIGQPLMKNAKTIKFKCDIISNFQILCLCTSMFLKFRAWNISCWYGIIDIDIIDPIAASPVGVRDLRDTNRQFLHFLVWKKKKTLRLFWVH